jgi:hypothetical protein
MKGSSLLADDCHIEVIVRGRISFKKDEIGVNRTVVLRLAARARRNHLQHPVPVNPLIAK